MDKHRDGLRARVEAFRLRWAVLTFYERFEEAVSHVLSAIIAVIIAVSLWQLIGAVFEFLTSGSSPLEHGTFQALFGMVMTVLIAMEFNHSITKAMLRRGHIVQVKTVLLVALLAIARKFIILEHDSEPGTVVALAFSLLALGGVYWLIRQRDDPLDAAAEEQARRAQTLRDELEG